MSARAVFRDEQFFEPAQQAYRLLPFNFTSFSPGRILLVNEVGEHLLMDTYTFHEFVGHALSPNSDDYFVLKSKHFLADSASRAPYELLSVKYRTKRGFLADFTKLHIFVVSLRCEHSCHYCQVSRVSPDHVRYDMTVETADRALDLVFRSPSRQLKIEFQGGEPLLNFDLIRHIVEHAEERAREKRRQVEFVIASNLALLTNEMLDFFHSHQVFVSTSLDGPAFIHNANRPRPGSDSYERAIRGIERVREALGRDRVSAVMTTTRLSLGHPSEIVDEYISRGFNSIFLRSLSPYGFAVKTVQRTGYSADQFLDFYFRALDHIIDLNRQGRFFAETYAQIILTKMLTPFTPGYVDLQSPSGAGIGAAIYNYDGDVYPSDESRMLAEMGDRQLRLGNVHRNSYEEIFGGKLAQALVASSIVEATPMCADCAFQNFCGSDPTFNYATQGDFMGSRPTSEFHRKNEAIIRRLFELYHGDKEIARIFHSWVQNKPVAELLRTQYAAVV